MSRYMLPEIRSDALCGVSLNNNTLHLVILQCNEYYTITKQIRLIAHLQSDERGIIYFDILFEKAQLVELTVLFVEAIRMKQPACFN